LLCSLNITKVVLYESFRLMGMMTRSKIPWVMEVTMLKASCVLLTVVFPSSGLYQPAEGTSH